MIKYDTTTPVISIAFETKFLSYHGMDSWVQRCSEILISIQDAKREPQTFLEGNNGNFSCDIDNYQDEPLCKVGVYFLCDIHKLMRQWIVAHNSLLGSNADCLKRQGIRLKLNY